MKRLGHQKIWGWRQSLIGDQIMALPLLNWADVVWPGSFKYWQIARKCVQAAPLYYNHPLINELVISDCNEGMGPRDIAIAQKCDIVINTMPQHPDGNACWANYRDIYHETARMAGLTDEVYFSIPKQLRIPKLTKWFETERRKGAIALWPCAAYGVKQQWHSRHPSYVWAQSLVDSLISEGYKVYQLGHPNDYSEEAEGGVLQGAVDSRKLSFFEQVQFTLGCDLMIGTDSGSSLAIGAYQIIPQISLLTNHMHGHVQNFTAFATNSPMNVSFVGVGSCDNILVHEVIAKTKEMV